MMKIVISERQKKLLEKLLDISEQTFGPRPPKRKPRLPLYTPSYAEMKVSDKGLELIKKHENFEPEQYVCPAGKLTIGYGTRISSCPELKGKKISDEVATGYLKKHITDEIIPVIKNNVKVPLGQPQIDALVALIHNIGSGNFLKSNLLKNINLKDKEAALRDWKEFKLSKGKVQPGLEQRRQEEINLFFQGK